MTNKNWLSRPLYFLITVLAFGVLTLPASAQTKVTALIAITNTTVNGMTFVLNGSTRTFTNVVYNSAAQVLTNSDVTGNGSKTNLLTQIYGNPFAQVLAVDVGSNTFALVGNANLAMSATLSAGLGTVSYSTQTVASVIGLQGPISALPTAVSRTNNASAIVGAANAVENTNKISQISTAASELMGLTNGQTISGVKVFTSALGQWFGLITNSPGISGTIIALTGGLLSGCTITNATIHGTIGVVKNGYWTNGIIDHPTLTNGVNYGNALSSPGTNGDSSENFGRQSFASGDFSLAVGSGAGAQGHNGTAIGHASIAFAESTTAVGNGAGASTWQASAFGASASSTGTNSTSVGAGSFASGNNSTAIGEETFAIHDNSTAVGTGATTTTSNQVMLGASGISTVVQNDLTVQTNLYINGNATIYGNQTNGAHIGTNTYGANADIAFIWKNLSSLANGNNAAIPIGTNKVIEVSGPTGSFTINGIASGRAGKEITIINQSGFQMTIANESGTDPTAANRIRTLGPGADLIFTNASVDLKYSGAASRWVVTDHNP